MEITSAQVSAAIVAGVVSIIVATISAIITLIVANRRAHVDRKLADARAHVDRDLAELQGKFARELAEQKDRLDNRTTFAAEQVARALMMDETWKWRSFRIIKQHLGGFEDDELRKILVRAGAIRVRARDGEELWGLLDRNRENIGVEQLSSDPDYRFRENKEGNIEMLD